MAERELQTGRRWLVSGSLICQCVSKGRARISKVAYDRELVVDHHDGLPHAPHGAHDAAVEQRRVEHVGAQREHVREGLARLGLVAQQQVERHRAPLVPKVDGHAMVLRPAPVRSGGGMRRSMRRERVSSRLGFLGGRICWSPTAPVEPQRLPQRRHTSAAATSAARARSTGPRRRPTRCRRRIARGSRRRARRAPRRARRRCGARRRSSCPWAPRPPT